MFQRDYSSLPIEENIKMLIQGQIETARMERRKLDMNSLVTLVAKTFRLESQQAYDYVQRALGELEGGPLPETPGGR